MRITEPQNDTYIVDVNSWGELLDKAENGLPSTNRGRSSRKENNLEFSGTKTFGEAVIFAKRGWPEQAKKIALNSSRLFAKTKSWVSYQEKIEYAVCGHSIDIAKFVEGEPECVMEIGYQKGSGSNKKRIIKIDIPFSYSWQLTPEEILKHGSRVVALIQLVEFSGYNTYIQASSYKRNSYSNSRKIGIHFPLKLPDQPLDLNRIAFALCHPSFLRRIFFSFEETLPKKIVESIGFNLDSDYGESIGYKAELTTYQPDLAIENLTKNSGITSDEAWLKGKIEQLKVL